MHYSVYGWCSMIEKMSSIACCLIFIVLPLTQFSKWIMKHDEVVAALKIIADKGMAINISKEDLQSLKTYNLIDIVKGEEKERSPACSLTKKGRVMLKANIKPDSAAE